MPASDEDDGLGAVEKPVVKPVVKAVVPKPQVEEVVSEISSPPPLLLYSHPFSNFTKSLLFPLPAVAAVGGGV